MADFFATQVDGESTELEPGEADRAFHISSPDGFGFFIAISGPDLLVVQGATEMDRITAGVSAVEAFAN